MYGEIFLVQLKDDRGLKTTIFDEDVNYRSIVRVATEKTIQYFKVFGITIVPLGWLRSS